MPWKYMGVKDSSIKSYGGANRFQPGLGATEAADAQIARVVADGGTIINADWIRNAIYTLKAQGIYSSCKFLADANFAVKKDGSDAVSTLYDISGNNNDATQGTGSAQPIWTAAQQNGKAGLVFDGSDDYLSLPVGASVRNLTNYQYIATAKETSGNLSKTIYAEADNGGPNSVLDIFNSPHYADFGLHNGSWLNATDTVELSTSSFYILSGTLNNSTGMSLHKNGAVAGTSANTNPGTKTITYVEIGRSRGYAGEFAGPIANVLTFSAVLSTAQRQALESLINGYYAIY